MDLDSKHPTELVVVLLDKITKIGILRSNISSERNLLLLYGPKGGLEVDIVSRWWLGRRARSCLTRLKGSRMGCELNNLGVTRYPIRVSSRK